LYNFAWAEVFDWYLELAKTPLRDEERGEQTKATLGVVLRDLLKLFHPAIPFLTEELWSELGDGSLLITGAWPEPLSFEGPATMGILQDLIAGLRRFRSEHRISPKVKFEVILHDPEGVGADWWHDHLTGLAGVAIVDGDPSADVATSRVVAGPVQAFIPLEGLVDLDDERARLAKAVTETAAEFDRSQAKLGNPKFRERAPADVVTSEETKADEARARLDKLEAQLAELG
jgi:valyl-tRNA synthetase